METNNNSPRPSWLDKKETTRSRSGKQEKKLSKAFGGKTTCNSGAKFGENDVVTPQFEIEAKTTLGKGYRLTLSELNSIKRKCSFSKIPLQIIAFEETGDSFVILSLDDFKTLVKLDE